jgi:hypothetical protein
MPMRHAHAALLGGFNVPLCLSIAWEKTIKMRIATAAIAGYSSNGGTSNNDGISMNQHQPASAEGDEGYSVIKEEDFWQSAFETFAAAAEQDVGNETSEDELETLTEQLDQYLGMPLQTRTGNLLLWWKDHAAHFPMLAKLTRKYLATPASSVYSERLFSEYGNIY